MSLRLRLLVVFLLSVLTGLGSVVYWVLDELEPRYQEAQEDILVDFTEFAAAWIGEQAVQVNANGNIQIDTGQGSGWTSLMEVSIRVRLGSVRLDSNSCYGLVFIQKASLSKRWS